MPAVESLAFFAIGIVAIGLLSRALRLRYLQWQFSNQHRAAIAGILVVFVSILIISLLAIMLGSASAIGNDPENKSPEKYTFGNVLGQAVVLLIAIMPILIAMRTRKEPLASAGITRQNLPGATVLGLVLVVAQLLYLAATTGFRAGSTLGHFWAFLQYSVVGFAEEFMFRGYLQTRLCAGLGKSWGWLLTSVLMAFSHFAHRMSFEHLDTMAALTSCVSLIPVSLLLGFLYLRSGNIMAPGIYHTFANWIETL